VSPKTLVEAFEEQTFEDAYKGRFGGEGIKRLKEAIKKVKAGKLTFRQAASTLGISYFELCDAHGRKWRAPCLNA
jgi:hypothetical protein